MDGIKIEVTDRYDSDNDEKLNGDYDLNFDNNILLQNNNDLGRCIMEELVQLKKSSKERNVMIVCTDTVLSVHTEAVLLSTRLLEDYPVYKGCDVTVLCEGTDSSVVAKVIDVLYTGTTTFSSVEEQKLVMACLRNFGWEGSTGKGVEDEGEEEGPEQEQHRERGARGQRRRLNKPARGRLTSDPEIFDIIKQHPSLSQEGKRIYCDLCDAYISSQVALKSKLTNHLKSRKHRRAEAGLAEAPSEGPTDDLLHVDKDDERSDCGLLSDNDVGSRLSDGEDEDEDENDDESPDENLNNEEFRERLKFFYEDEDGGGGNSMTMDEDDSNINNGINNDSSQQLNASKYNEGPQSISIQARLEEFEDLIELDGHVMCRYCKVPLKWRIKSYLYDHMRTVRHCRRKKIALSKLKGSENSCGRNGDEESSNADGKAEKVASSSLEKFSQKLDDFPWLTMVQEEVMCVLCKWPIANWSRRYVLVNHEKSKKHQAAIEEKKHIYPVLIKKIEDVKENCNFVDNRPNYSSKLSYRIYLKSGTSALEKLWITGCLTGTIVEEVSICYLCFNLFLEEEELLKHLQNTHEGAENRLLDSPNFNRETKEYYCNGCKKFVEHRKSLMCFLLHNLKCTNRFQSVNVPLKCFKCDDFFGRYKEFRLHMGRVHVNAMPDRRLCSECPKSFLSSNELKYHVKKVHVDRKPFKCGQCPVTFKTRKSVSRHVAKVHTGERNFSCEKCGKQFYSKYDLAKHMRTHMEPEQRPHSCRVCGTRFKELKHLNNHEATHSEDRPHKCLMCDSKFKIRDRLSKHYLKDHGISMKEVEAKMKSGQNSFGMDTDATINNLFIGGHNVL